jgi:Oxysterol-binding protein
MKALRRVLTSSGLFHSPTKFDAEHELDRAVLHVDAHDEGGLACNDDALLAEMRACIMAWIKSMGRQLLAGNLNLVNTSFPVRMFEPRSYLEKLADAWAQPVLLNAAAAAADPLERMKLLVAWLVAGVRHILICMCSHHSTATA